MPSEDTVVRQIDALLSEIEPKIHPAERSGYWFRGTEPERSTARTRALAMIRRLAPAGSAYVADAEREQIAKASDGKAVVWLAGILRALREDYAAGYLQTVEELVRADLFADFLEMADELAGKNYKGPAAVVAGSVLEEHLRKLATKHGVELTENSKPKKADTLNADLVKVEAYNKIQQKIVTGWLGIRNDAAHGNHDGYTDTQVAGLIRDVRDFLVRHPA